MSTYTDLVAAIETQIDGISNIGLTYTYWRYLSDPEDFKALFVTSIASTDQIRAWVISLAAPAIEVTPAEFGTNDWVYHFLVTGIQGLSDAANTESTLIQNAELVIAALADTVVFGTSGEVVRSVRVGLRTVEHRQYASHLCNVAEIPVDVTVVKSY